ncbi:MAG: PLDc N-terminal domain-containing protein [Verrucomicrobiae bacterium]|nr:PLDc N-terminal domain-containing protein [Verrucomicrobiae bacterium]MCB1086585.1 PLDc N-terminal domain-containing protein [Verrucomicrobiae bacterium]
MVHVGLFVTWLILVAAAMMSLRSQEMSITAKWIWFAIIVALPIVGLAIYAIRCLFTADFSFLKFLLGPSKTAKSVRG